MRDCIIRSFPQADLLPDHRAERLELRLAHQQVGAQVGLELALRHRGAALLRAAGLERRGEEVGAGLDLVLRGGGGGGRGQLLADARC